VAPWWNRAHHRHQNLSLMYPPLWGYSHCTFACLTCQGRALVMWFLISKKHILSGISLLIFHNFCVPYILLESSQHRPENHHVLLTCSAHYEHVYSICCLRDNDHQRLKRISFICEMELSCLWYGVYFPNLQNCLTYHLQMQLKKYIYIYIYIYIHMHTHTYVSYEIFLPASNFSTNSGFMVTWMRYPSKQYIPESQAGPARKVKQLSDRTGMEGATLRQVILHKYKWSNRQKTPGRSLWSYLAG
jgi:hypothetical protein